MANDCLEDLSQLYLQLLALKSISYNCLCDLLDYLITNTELTYYEGKEALTRLTSQNKEKVLSEVLDFYGEVKLKITDQIARAVYSDVKNKVVCASIDFKQLDILTVLKILRNIPLIKNKIGNNNILQQCFKIIECMRTLTSHKEEFEFWEELNTQYYPQGIVYFNQLSNPPQDKDMLLIQCCNGIQEIAEYLKKNGRYNVNDYDCIVSKLENIKIYSKQDLINNYTSLIVSQLLIMEHYKSIDSTLMTLNNKTNVLKFNVEVADIINSETKEHSTFQYEDVQIGTELYNKILHLIKQTLEKNLGVKSGPDTYEVYIYEMNFKTISAPCKPMQVGVFEVKVKPGESSLNWNSLYDPISPQTTKIREKLSESIRENVVKLYNHNIKVLIKKWDIGSLIIHFSLSRHNNENLYLDKDLRSNIINIITIAVKNIFPNEEVEMARLLPSYITLPNVLDIGCSTLVNDYSLTKVILEWTSNRSNLNIQLGKYQN